MYYNNQCNIIVLLGFLDNEFISAVLKTECVCVCVCPGKPHNVGTFIVSLRKIALKLF